MEDKLFMMKKFLDRFANEKQGLPLVYLVFIFTIGLKLGLFILSLPQNHPDIVQWPMVILFLIFIIVNISFFVLHNTSYKRSYVAKTAYFLIALIFSLSFIFILVFS